MPSADFCTALKRLAARAVHFEPKGPYGARCRPHEVSSAAFRTSPPEFTPDALDGYGLRVTLPARPAPIASYPVLVHWLMRLLALPSDPISRWQPLRFAILHLHQVGAETLTPLAVEHARHTGCARSARRLTPPLTAAAAPAQSVISNCLTQLLRSSDPTDSAAKFLVPSVILNQRLSNPSVHGFGATSIIA
ncbi:MAG: hypothetical protein JOZ45_11165 [Acidobacteriaceae bacterium]|nr:hypothetical protein [Acidobacteriaceae bacterium]